MYLGAPRGLLIKSHSALCQLARLCDEGFSPPIFSKTCTTRCWKMMVVSVLKRTSWCRTFVLGFAGSVATAIATYGATLRCAPYINVLLKDIT